MTTASTRFRLIPQQSRPATRDAREHEIEVEFPGRGPKSTPPRRMPALVGRSLLHAGQVVKRRSRSIRPPRFRRPDREKILLRKARLRGTARALASLKHDPWKWPRAETEDHARRTPATRGAVRPLPEKMGVPGARQPTRPLPNRAPPLCPKRNSAGSPRRCARLD